MRRQDKKIAMKKANLLFEQRCNENSTAFNWNGEYANEDTNEGTVSFGGDIEITEVDEEVVNEFETTDVENSQFFSDEDGDRLTDKYLDT
jgi:hypothetical protein